MVLQAITLALALTTQLACEDGGLRRTESGHVLVYPVNRLPVNLVLSPELETDWAVATRAAAEMWNDVLGFEVFTVGTTSSTTANVAVTPEKSDTLPTTHTYVFWASIESFVTLPQPIAWAPEYEDKAIIMMHELGHVLGLAHDASPLSVMYPRYLKHLRNWLEIEGRDIDLLRKIYESPSQDVSPKE